jgi:protein SCO1
MPRAGFIAVAMLVILAFGGTARAQEYNPLHSTLGPLPEFTLTDQNGHTVQREQLVGKICVVSFFFSCCADVCPKTQAAMARLQEQLAGFPDVLLVSINVFPSNDTQEVLTSYAKNHKADPERWLFLRGDEAEIGALVRNGFKQGMERNTSGKPGYEVIHTANLLVVDHRGVIRGYANGLDPEEVDRLAQHVKHLVLAKYFPTINASLNGACGLLLVLGFVLIRTRQVLAHKICMLMALGVSAVFLGSYLFYHFVVLDGQPTRFTGEGPVRYLYLGILLSHTLLAVLVAPLALRVTYLGLRNRLARHRALAQWTLPLWLYVSVTGVVVYWMLYHLYPPL